MPGDSAALEAVRTHIDSIVGWIAGPETLQANKDDIVAELHLLYEDLDRLMEAMRRSPDARDLRACNTKFRQHGGEIIMYAGVEHASAIEEIRGWATLWVDFKEAADDLKVFVDRIPRAVSCQLAREVVSVRVDQRFRVRG